MFLCFWGSVPAVCKLRRLDASEHVKYDKQSIVYDDYWAVDLLLVNRTSIYSL
jgi:hypothetical protein